MPVNTSVLKKLDILAEFLCFSSHCSRPRLNQRLGYACMHIALRLHGVMHREISKPQVQDIPTIGRQSGRILLSNRLEHGLRAGHGFSEESANREAFTSSGKVFSKTGAASDYLTDLGETALARRVQVLNRYAQLLETAVWVAVLTGGRRSALPRQAGGGLAHRAERFEKGFGTLSGFQRT